IRRQAHPELAVALERSRALAEQLDLAAVEAPGDRVAARTLRHRRVERARPALELVGMARAARGRAFVVAAARDQSVVGRARDRIVSERERERDAERREREQRGGR